MALCWPLFAGKAAYFRVSDFTSCSSLVNVEAAATSICFGRSSHVFISSLLVMPSSLCPGIQLDNSLKSVGFGAMRLCNCSAKSCLACLVMAAAVMTLQLPYIMALYSQRRCACQLFPTGSVFLTTQRVFQCDKTSMAGVLRSIRHHL